MECLKGYFDLRSPIIQRCRMIESLVYVLESASSVLRKAHAVAVLTQRRAMTCAIRLLSKIILINVFQAYSWVRSSQFSVVELDLFYVFILCM